MVIYLITNLINNKKYIGKTNNFMRRYQEHFSESHTGEEQKVLYLAMKKYGANNFQMSIIEECDDNDWPQREKYWIHQYNSIIPNGYNMVDGGEEPPHYFGEKNPLHILTQEQVNEIILLLQTYSVKELSNYEISYLYKISIDQIRKINLGTAWKQDNISYPIRCYNSNEELDMIYSLLETWEYTCEEIGKMLGKTKSCIKAINNGQNYFDPNRIYPIKPPKIFYPKKIFYQAVDLIKQGYNNNEIIKITGMQLGTLKNLREGKYDKYLTCND